MRSILVAGVALALSACGGSGETADDANALGADNMVLDENMMLDENGSMDANAAGDANLQNMMLQDATTNDPDTNLANGL